MVVSTTAPTTSQKDDNPKKCQDVEHGLLQYVQAPILARTVGRGTMTECGTDDFDITPARRMRSSARTYEPLGNEVRTASRRIRMLAQSRLNYLSAVLVGGLLILSLAVASAVEPEQTSHTAPKAQRTTNARTAILHGRVTDEAGAPLADVRVRVAIPATDMRHVDVSTPHKRLETKTDARGKYRLEIPGIADAHDGLTRRDEARLQPVGGHLEGRRRSEERRSRSGHGGRSVLEPQARTLFRRRGRGRTRESGPVGEDDRPSRSRPARTGLSRSPRPTRMGRSNSSAIPCDPRVKT